MTRIVTTLFEKLNYVYCTRFQRITPRQDFDMADGLRILLGMAKFFLDQGIPWWKMPFVVILAFSFYHREELLGSALFDSYPNPLPKNKLRCNDPMLGKLELNL